MSVFSSRTPAYKIGVGLLLFMTALFVTGLVAPYWATAKSYTRYLEYTADYSFFDGLWMLCTSTDIPVGTSSLKTGCSRYGFTGFPAWFHVVRTFEALCFMGLVIACIYAVVTNWCRTFPSPRTRILEILTGVAGGLGFLGSMVYVGMRLGKEQYDDVQIKNYVSLFQSLDWDFNWALYFCAIGSAACVIAAIVIGVGNKQVAGAPLMSGVVMTTFTAQPGYGYAPQSYVGGSNPGAVPSHPYVGGSNPGAVPSHPYVGGSNPGGVPSHPYVGGSEPGAVPSHRYVGGSEPRAVPSHRYVGGSEPEAVPSHRYVGGSEPETVPSHRYVGGSEPRAVPSHPYVGGSDHGAVPSHRYVGGSEHGAVHSHPYVGGSDHGAVPSHPYVGGSDHGAVPSHPYVGGSDPGVVPPQSYVAESDYTPDKAGYPSLY